MDKIIIKCDRCGGIFEGLLEKSGPFKGATGGFYDVRNGYWGKFARYGEEYICDDCMHADLLYQQVYGRPDVSR